MVIFWYILIDFYYDYSLNLLGCDVFFNRNIIENLQPNTFTEIFLGYPVTFFGNKEHPNRSNLIKKKKPMADDQSLRSFTAGGGGRYRGTIKRGLGTERARLGTFRGFGTEHARLGTFRGFLIFFQNLKI